MTIALDAVASKSATYGNTTWTHTPVGTPKGILVFCHEYEDMTDVITVVSYGGVALTRVLFVGATGDAHNSGEYAYFLGTGIPTGAQTVSVTHSAAKNMTYESISFTSTTDMTEVVDAESFGGSGAAPRGTSLSLEARTCWVGMGYSTEHYSPVQFAPMTGWTESRETDHGNSCTGYYVYDTIGSSDVAWGMDVSSSTTLDIAMIGVAVSEKSIFIPQIIMS